MSRTIDISSDEDPDGFRTGKDELNFAEFPIALLTDRVPKGQNSIKFEDQIYDERRKRVITRRRIIEGSDEYGLPTATDDIVILGLIQLTKQQNNFTKRDVEFTRLELIKMLGWPDEGRSYDRIKLSLQRIANVTYNYDKAWWDNRQKAWTTKIFHILDTVEISDSRASNGQGMLFPSRIAWNEVVFDSFQAGFLRNIDFQLCMRFEHPTALRIYRFMGKRFYMKPDWTFELREFAYDYIGLGRNYQGGTQIARKLQPAIEELEDIGFLERLDEKERFPKQGREWSVRFLQKGSTSVSSAPNPLLLTVDRPLLLAAELIDRGVTKAKAAELVKKHPARFLEAKIEIFDWLSAEQDERVRKSPAGYLVKSIEEDYVTPKGFLARPERHRRDEARRGTDHRAAEDQRRRR
jgi:hypothetical protein